MRLLYSWDTTWNGVTMSMHPTIAIGAQGPDVRWAQYLLVRRTLSYPQIDGIFGPVTQHAVEEFQATDNLTVDGVVGVQTWAALGGERPEPPVLAEGAQGSTVEKLQTALNEGRGDFAPATNPVLALDGLYDPQTTAAVMGTQTAGSIPADGVVGLQTWALPIHAAGGVLAGLCDVLVPGE
jgi:peptidoglycan hydrolase-like protein with peptidoglycan-binding domain